MTNSISTTLPEISENECQLKPCPFCGAEASYSERQLLNADDDLIYVELISCDSCEASVTSLDNDDIYASWNLRHIPAADKIRAKINKLEGLIKCTPVGSILMACRESSIINLNFALEAMEE